MQRYKFLSFPRPHSGLASGKLLAFWTGGIILGTAIGAAFAAVFSFWMRQALNSPVSIVGMGVCHVLPLLLTAGFVFCGVTGFVYLLSCLKGFSIGFTASACILSFGGAGWLVRLLFLFSQFASVPMLWIVWLGLCREKPDFAAFGYGMLYLVLVTFADYYVVAPYLAKLLF